MLVHPPFDDEVLGRVIWNAEDSCWNFDAGPVNSRSVPACYIPEDSQRPAAEHGWDGVRACLVWVRANEAKVRAHIVEKVHNPTPIPLWLWLTGINFFKDREARLIYGCCGLVISVQVNAAGIVGMDQFVS